VSEPRAGSERAPGAQPITFVSHFRVKPGHAPAFREMWDDVAAALEKAKPATTAYLAYLAADDAALTIVHVFPDADAMAAHFGGSDERAAAAYEHIEPAGWEVYGAPHTADLEQLRAASERSGVGLSVLPEALGGFLRAAPR
jgi:quinol monooxygenase YgiN